MSVDVHERQAVGMGSLLALQLGTMTMHSDELRHFAVRNEIPGCAQPPYKAVHGVA